LLKAEFVNYVKKANGKKNLPNAGFPIVEW